MRSGRSQIKFAVRLVAFVIFVVICPDPSSAERPFHLKDEMSASAFDRCGLAKLTVTELAALDKWVEGRISATTAPPISSASVAIPPPLALQSATTVVFNTKTRKYHCPACRSARQCTRNCISVSLEEASQRGGVPCSSCGGLCR